MNFNKELRYVKKVDRLKTELKNLRHVDNNVNEVRKLTLKNARLIKVINRQRKINLLVGIVAIATQSAVLYFFGGM